jgi:hypothetical protein
MSPDQLLHAIDQLNSSELNPFVAQVLALLARRRAPCLTVRESELLRKINVGLPPAAERRYRILADKRRAETLTPTERDELLRISDQCERLAAERVGYLIELAQLREVSLPQLMDDLGIEPPPVE